VTTSWHDGDHNLYSCLFGGSGSGGYQFERDYVSIVVVVVLTYLTYWWLSHALIVWEHRA